MAAPSRWPQVSASRGRTCTCFLFGGDGDAFSIGGNHLEHGARKNINLTYVIMDNFVYGLTKKQTSPTSPIGFKSKTDPDRRDRSTGQSDQETARRRRDLHRAHATPRRSIT
jgi:2-oxoglutarate ferredoxin oxidoreductase subunit beta